MPVSLTPMRAVCLKISRSREGLHRHLPACRQLPSLHSVMVTAPRLSVKLHPFATGGAFGFSVSPDAQMTSVSSVLPSTLLPGFIGRKFNTTTGSSATRQSISPSLSLLLSGDICLQNSTGLPRLISAPCERSHPQSLNCSLSEYRASPYFAGLPTAGAESGSLTLCTVHFLSLPSDPTVTSCALAIRIDFPSDGVSLLSFKQTGPRLCRANKKGLISNRKSTP